MSDSVLSGDTVSVLYGLVGVFTLFRLVQQRSSFFDRIVTEEDMQLVWLIAFFLLTPLGVLAHEAGHYFAAEYYGATNVELNHRGYWGFVTYSGTFDSSTQLLITGAGPFVGTVLGLAGLAGAIVLPVRMIFRHLLASFGFLEVFHHLVGYPLYDLLSDFGGDFHTIYSLLPTHSAVAVGLVHLGLVALLSFSWQVQPRKWEGVEAYRNRLARLPQRPAIPQIPSSVWFLLGLTLGIATVVSLILLIDRPREWLADFGTGDVEVVDSPTGSPKLLPAVASLETPIPDPTSTTTRAFVTTTLPATSTVGIASSSTTTSGFATTSRSQP